MPYPVYLCDECQGVCTEHDHKMYCGNIDCGQYLVEYYGPEENPYLPPIVTEARNYKKNPPIVSPELVAKEMIRQIEDCKTMAAISMGSRQQLPSRGNTIRIRRPVKFYASDEPIR